VRALAELPRSPDLLNLVVIGPRRGESVLVGSPGGRWLVVDSMTGDAHPNQDTDHPVLAAADLLGAEIGLLALTHPHDDHAMGFSDLVNASSAPVGCVPQLVLDPSPPPTTSSGLFYAAAVDDALAAIAEAWARTDGDRVWTLTPGPDGDRWLDDDVLVEVLSPSPQEVADEIAREKPNLNAISTAMRVTWRGLELILGADLTTAGWQAVSARRGGSGAAAAVHKGSHHGSSTGHHSWALGDAPPADRAVVITPYSIKVPNFSPTRDVDLLHTTIAAIRMTAVRGVPAGDPVTVTSAEVRHIRLGSFPGVDTVSEHPPHLAWNAWWAWSLDERGTIVDVRHGTSAKVVTP
jgi:beta-lactamase superfamily II metal-dependent hydrolase